MADIRIPGGILTVAGTYKPGDLPPEGYLDWHEWAEVQRKAGIKQVPCVKCGRYKTPQELSGKTHTWSVMTSRGHSLQQSGAICAKCDAIDMQTEVEKQP